MKSAGRTAMGMLLSFCLWCPPVLAATQEQSSTARKKGEGGGSSVVTSGGGQRGAAAGGMGGGGAVFVGDAPRGLDPQHMIGGAEAFAKKTDHEARISKIREEYFQQKITVDVARQRLLPLVRESVQASLADIVAEIQALETRVASLKEMRRAPDVLVEQRIKEMLGMP